MHPEEVLIPLGFFAAVFGYFFLRSKENMALIEKGINPRKNYGGPQPYAFMKYALLLIGAGLGLLFAYLADVFYLHEATRTVKMDGSLHYNNNPAIYFALIGIGGGLGLFIAYKMEKKDLPAHRDDE